MKCGSLGRNLVVGSDPGGYKWYYISLGAGGQIPPSFLLFRSTLLHWFESSHGPCDKKGDSSVGTLGADTDNKIETGDQVEIKWRSSGDRGGER